RALMNVIPENTITRNINPIITREQYIGFNKTDPIKNGQIVLFKIHGSKKNIITGVDTSQSLVTTLSALGKDREEGKTFTIEAYKKPAIYQVLENRTLVVLGYSGSDDFDIAPFIKELKTCKKIIWIDHDASKKDSNSSEIFNYNALKSKIESNQASKQEKFLFDIKSENNIEIILIKTNTAVYVSEVLWSLLIDTFSKPKLPDVTEKTPQAFREYLKSLKVYSEINSFTKYLFAINIYEGLGEWKKALRSARKGLELAISEGNKKQEGEFLIKVGAQLIYDSKLEEALNLILEAKKIHDELHDYDGIVTCISAIGNILFSIAKFEEAFDFFKQAFDLIDKVSDIEDKTAIMINLGSIQDTIGDRESALSSYKKALNFANQSGQLDDKAIILKHIGLVQMSLLEYKEAINYFKQSFEIFELIGDLRELAGLYNLMGMTYFKMEDYKNTLDCFFTGIQLAIDIGSLKMQAIIALQLAKYYDFAELEEEATQYFQAAMELVEKVEDIEIKMQCLSEVAISCYNKKAYDVALDYFDIELILARETGNNLYINQALEWMAAIYLELSDYKKAQEIYAEIIDLIDKSGDVNKKADYLMNLGKNWYETTNNIQQSITYLQESQKIYENQAKNDMVKQIREEIKNIKERSKSE
ncbi:MAG: tetratricopeptide repeat protein, partial [Promethearchaeota archaeon]